MSKKKTDQKKETKAKAEKNPAPKKVTKVKEKEKPVRKFTTKDKKEVVVQNKEERDVKEVKEDSGKKQSVDIKKMISDLIKIQFEDYATSRGQVPTGTEFQVIQRSQSSVEIKKDAKDKIVFTIKAYADTTFNAAVEAIENFNKVIQEVDSDEEE